MNRKELKLFAKIRNLDIDFGKLPKMNVEIWKKYSNIMVSNYGNIKDAVTNNKIEIITAPNGRSYVKTDCGRKYITHLVYDLFYKKDRKNLVIHHIDEDLSNNRADNLIAVTRKIHKGLHFNKMKSHKRMDHTPVLRNMMKVLNNIEFSDYDSNVQEEIIEFIETLLKYWKSEESFVEVKPKNTGIYVDRSNYDTIIAECNKKYNKITRKNLKMLGISNYDSVYHLWYKDNK
jgi:hypothetical protein